MPSSRPSTRSRSPKPSPLSSRPCTREVERGKGHAGWLGAMMGDKRPSTTNGGKVCETRSMCSSRYMLVLLRSWLKSSPASAPPGSQTGRTGRSSCRRRGCACAARAGGQHTCSGEVGSAKGREDRRGEQAEPCTAASHQQCSLPASSPYATIVLLEPLNLLAVDGRALWEAQQPKQCGQAVLITPHASAGGELG